MGVPTANGLLFIWGALKKKKNRYSHVPIDQLTARFREGHGGWHS
jgi:hypothetical protein